MIESIQAVNYESYNVINNGTSAAKNKNEEPLPVFNIQTLLKTLGEYTYSEDDIEVIDENLISGLKKKFDIEDKDIYKLKKNGYDLERLYMDDINYYAATFGTESTVSSGLAASNEVKVEQVGDKVDIIKNENDTMYLNTLYSNGPVTINSLYQSNYKGGFQKNNISYTKQDIVKILEMNGLDTTKGNMWAASKLAEYGMDINRHDVVKLQNIKAAVSCLDKQEELSKAEEDLAAGKEPGERPLLKDDKIIYDHKEIKEIKEELGQVEDQSIEELIANEEEITIGSLRATLFRNTDLALRQNKAPVFSESQRKSVQAVKDQLNQIRTKLTTEAAQKLSERMPLESSRLSEVVEALSAIEAETIAEAFKEVDIPLTEQNIEIIRNVMSARQEIVEKTEAALELEIATNESIQINEMHQALLRYQQNETPVEQRFGENIRTVESQIKGLLMLQGIEASQGNMQAAKALVMNGMDVNEESITNTLHIMSKINTFVEEMTPAKTAQLIKEGLNPYRASIDTLLGWISESGVEKLKSSIAETIVALQEQGVISSEQKDALIGFYRIIQTVSNNREEVVGYLFKNKLPLTIEKLQEAAKYMGDQGIIEAAIDDNFGEIKELKYASQPAKMILEENSDKIHRGIDIIKILEQMELPVTDTNIEKLKKINALLYPLIKSEFRKEFGKFEGMETLPKSFLEKLEVIKKVDPKVVSYMLKEGIALTVSNIYWIDKIIKNPDTYKDLLKEGALIKENLPQSFEEFEENLERQEKEAVQNKEAALEKGNIIEYRTYKQIEEVVHLQKELSQKDGVYQIPFMIQGEEKMVHLYFNKKQNKQTIEDGTTTAVMTYDTKQLGTITAYIQFREDKISYKVQGENDETTQKLQQGSTFLEGLLEQIGYLVNTSEYTSYTNSEEVSSKPSLIKKGDSDFEEMV